MASGLLLVSAGAAGMALASSPFLALPMVFLLLPMVFLLGTARASSPLGYSILGNLGTTGSRAGRFGVYLTLEQLGFVAGSLVGGLLYALNPGAMLAVTFACFIVLAGLSWSRMEKLASHGQ